MVIGEHQTKCGTPSNCTRCTPVKQSCSSAAPLTWTTVLYFTYCPHPLSNLEALASFLPRSHHSSRWPYWKGTKATPMPIHFHTGTTRSNKLQECCQAQVIATLLHPSILHQACTPTQPLGFTCCRPLSARACAHFPKYSPFLCPNTAGGEPQASDVMSLPVHVLLDMCLQKLRGHTPKPPFL